jgi:hypothetical protein
MDRRMDNKLLRAVQRTVQYHCANCHSGNRCLYSPLGQPECFYFRELDSGQQVQRCRYFEESVLGNDPALEQEYHKKLSEYLAESDHPKPDKTVRTGRCDRCKRTFTKRSNSQKYCPSCKEAAVREVAKLSMRKRRLAERTAKTV